MLNSFIISVYNNYTSYVIIIYSTVKVLWVYYKRIVDRCTKG